MNGPILEKLENSVWIKVRDFPHPLEKFQIVAPDLIIVFMAPFWGDSTISENVYAVDSEGRLLWQIARAEPGIMNPGPHPFMALERGRDALMETKFGEFNEDDILVQSTYGDYYVVDVKSGQLTRVGFSRF